MTLAEIKGRLRAGAVAWPGGYPLFFITDDGSPLSFKAVRENWRYVVDAHLCRAKHGPGWFDRGWFIAGCDINWEDPDLFCDQTGERIPSAYAED